MSSEKSLAVILRVVEFSETSCVLTLFTEHFGKISALAKGARRPKSPFESAIDVLALCRIVFIHKSSDSLDLLTEARLERRFRAATRDLSRLYAGFYVAELLDGFTDTGDPHPELFTLADQTLKGLDGEEEVGPLILRFELRALSIVGHLPSFQQCVECGESMDNVASVSFGQLAGGVLCGSCRAGQRHVVRVARKTIDCFRSFADPDDQLWRSQETKTTTSGETRAVIGHYISHLLGRRPRLHAYLGVLGQ